MGQQSWKRHISNPLRSIFLIFILVWWSTSVYAKNAEEKQKEVHMENITVTANKMEEDIQNVPQSISVINEFEIEEKGIKSVTDVIKEIPNMLGTPNHGTGVNFRGINPSMFTSNNPVVIYIDGVPSSNRYGFDFSMANVERIEVLRGPQGTLYGKNAAGAVINVITKEAGNTWHGKIGAEYGSWNFLRGQANISGPLKEDTFFIGLNGQFSQTDGWIENEYPGMEDDVTRKKDHNLNGYLTFTPSERLRFHFSASSDYYRNHALNEQGLPNSPKLSDFDRDKAEHIRLDIEPHENVSIEAQSLNVSYDFDQVRMESITTHRTRKVRGIYDADFGDDPLFAGLVMLGDTDLAAWAEEFRVTSTNTTGLRWVTGLYLEDEEELQGPMCQEFPDFNPMTGAYLGASRMNAESDTKTTTQAIFGQAMIPLGSHLELTLGGRYQRIKKSMDLDMYYLPVGMTGPPMYSLSVEKAWYSFLPKAALSWNITDNWTTYASYSQGYMPGGFNNFAMGGRAEDNTFKPQRSANYEIGLKATYDTWRATASAFYMDITDIHIYKTVGAMYLTDNADKAHSTGLELEGVWVPLAGLEISGAVALMQAKYDDFDAGTANFDGEHIEGAPSHSARLGACYHHASGLYGRADIRHTGNVYYYDAPKETFQKEDAYTLMDLKIGYLYDGWDFYAYVKNITDEEYIDGFKSNSMFATANFGAPRSFGVGLSYAF